MQDEFDDHREYYCSLTHEYWCYLLSKIEDKYDRKMPTTQINNIASARAASISENKDTKGRRSQELGLVSCAPTKNPIKRRRSIKVTSAIVCFSRIQEYLIKSTRLIVPRAVLIRIPTIPSRMD